MHHYSQPKRKERPLSTRRRSGRPGALSDAVARQFVRFPAHLSVAFACTDLATRSDISWRSRYDVHIALWQVRALSQLTMQLATTYCLEVRTYRLEPSGQ